MSERVVHVWVSKPHMPTPYPGLVLAWRRSEAASGPGGWEAFVTYIERRVVDQPQVITEWLPADQLIAVPWRPGMGTAYG